MSWCENIVFECHFLEIFSELSSCTANLKGWEFKALNEGDNDGYTLTFSVRAVIAIVIRKYWFADEQSLIPLSPASPGEHAHT